MKSICFETFGELAMKKTILYRSCVASFCAATLICSGCDQQKASETLEKAEQSASETAAAVSDSVGEAVQKGEEAAGEMAKEGSEMAKDAVEKGKQVASDLSEKAAAYLTPIKEEFGSLDSLKEKPEELKAAVSKLIEKIETKAEDVELPEKVSNALATVKEKLVALKEYLEGEYEQAQIDERLQEIKETVKSSLGMSGE